MPGEMRRWERDPEEVELLTSERIDRRIRPASGTRDKTAAELQHVVDRRRAERLLEQPRTAVERREPLELITRLRPALQDDPVAELPAADRDTGMLARLPVHERVDDRRRAA